MQRLNGLWLVGAGLLLAIAMVFPAGYDAAQSLADVTSNSVAAAQVPHDDDSTHHPSLLAAPATAALAAFNDQQRTSPLEADRLVVAAIDQKTSDRKPARKPAAWSTVVTIDPEAASNSKFKSPKPGDWRARTELARDLQRALSRAGCYGGEITGSWTQSTRRAMAHFITEVNASLPVNEPDYILLTLVKSHPTTVCGGNAVCGVNEVLSSDGTCRPHDVVAQSETSRSRVAALGTAVVAPVKPSVTIEKLPWLDTPPAATAAVPPVAVAQQRHQQPQARPDGMMSVGAPRPTLDVPRVTELASRPAPTISGTQPELPTRVAVLRDDREHALTRQPLAVERADSIPTDAVRNAIAADDRLVEPQRATKLEKPRKERARRVARKSSRRDGSRRSARRAYSGYAWAQPSYSRRYYKRRFMAPFNMIQRLDGIY